MYDVLVLGAGVSGLAAARTLTDAGRRVLLVEARERIGGRVWTDHSFGAIPVECGAEFIHGDQAATWAWVRRAEAPTEAADIWLGRRMALEDGHVAGTQELEQRADLKAALALEHMLEAYTGPDMSLAAWLDMHGVTGLKRHLADIRMAHASCGAIETLSAVALAEEGRASAHNGVHDFHILSGYDSVLALLAEGLDIRLKTPVQRVVWGADGVTCRLASGEELQARAAVITLPLAVLKAGVVEFEPPLPEAQQRAIAGLDMQPAMKVIYRFRAPFWDESMTFLTLPDPMPVWWALRAGQPLLTCFLTGWRAGQAASLGEGVIARGLEHLAPFFGNVPQELFEEARIVDWGADAWALGGYSSSPLGSGGLRKALATPQPPLFFAGEATVYDDSPATVHGALRSGERAAQEVLSFER